MSTPRPHAAPAGLLRAVLALAVAACALVLPGSALAAEEMTPAMNTQASEASSGLAVTPMMVEDTIKPGDTSKHTVTLTNTTDEAQSFTLAKEDMVGNRSDPHSNPVLMGREFPSPISGYDWIDGFPSTVAVGPGDSKSFTVTVTAPSGSEGGHYAALTITSPPEDIGDVRAQSRAAVLFLMNAGGVPPPEVVIEDVVVRKDGSTVIDWINEGDTDVTPEGTISYRDPITGEIVSVRRAKDCTTALPGAMGRCDFEAVGKKPKQSPFALKPIAEIVASPGRTATADMPMQWSATWASMILPAAGAMMLLLFFLRRRRGEEEVDDLLSP